LPISDLLVMSLSAWFHSLTVVYLEAFQNGAGTFTEFSWKLRLVLHDKITWNRGETISCTLVLFSIHLLYLSATNKQCLCWKAQSQLIIRIIER
jgi:hypothetical protein